MLLLRPGELAEMLLRVERGGEREPMLLLRPIPRRCLLERLGELAEILLRVLRGGESVAMFLLAGEGALREGMGE